MELRAVWIWDFRVIDRASLQKLSDQGCKRVYLKVFDGRSNPMFWDDQCNTEILQIFADLGMEVWGWGYHYGTSNINAQIEAVKQALAFPITAYIVDAEVEVETVSTHPHMEALMRGLKENLRAGQRLGFTSFGHAGFHPNVPWGKVAPYVDIAIPQIYFELFNFGSTEEEVQACLDSYRKFFPSDKILPAWSSEPGAPNPASVQELQAYLDRFPGSSMWRLAGRSESSFTTQLYYDSSRTLPIIGGVPHQVNLPPLTRILRRGSLGDDVKLLQQKLNALGFNAGDEDGEYGGMTRAAVISFQMKAGLEVDGEVGPETWASLGGANQLPSSPAEAGIAERLAVFAEDEAKKSLSWNGPQSEAEKYLKPLRQPMRDLGQIGAEPVFYDWCGAFVKYCCDQVKLDVPVIPPGFWATLALVESWVYWAKNNGFWLSAASNTPRRGDIVIFDWPGDGVAYNHIGVVRGYTPGTGSLRTSEGNRGNKSGNFTRDISLASGYIRVR